MPLQQIHAQGTLVYDQQSATGPTSPYGNDFFNIQEDSPLMQSFIPTLSTIGFVEFEFWDIANNGTNGATVYVNLWTGSPDTHLATLLGSTAPTYMPNGFVNDNLFIAGVTNFYFSAPIALTSDQTYYLQPVVLSGDNPWDIMVLTNTYPGGQLYGSTGGFIQPSSDLWFREGVVPEPSALALVGLGYFLIFAFKRHSKLTVLLLFIALFLPILPVQAGPDSVVQVTADAAGLTSVSATALPDTGTFWVMTNSPDGNLMALPYPFLPSSLSALPTYSVVNNIFILDDTHGQLYFSSAGRMSSAQATSAAQMQTQTMEDLIEQIEMMNIDPTNIGGTNGGYQANGFTANFDTNGLWIEASNEAPNLGLRLHNTVGGDDYQLLSTTNLANHSWDLGEILFGAFDGYTDFTPVPMTNTMTFFRAHHANPIMTIEDNGDSEELNPTNTSDPGHAGSLYIYDKGWATNDVTVFYSIGGTAQNGIDYSNITGEVVVPASLRGATIDIEPIDDGLKPNQTIILTLLQNTNYLIDPSMCSATNILTANPQVYPIAHGDIQPVCPNITNSIYLRADDNLGLPLTYIILAWPTHGTLDTNGAPYATYASTNCYEGQDSFTFEVSDGQYTSTPATVNLTIADPVSAYSAYAQTCRGTTSQPFTLSGGDGCGEQLGWALVSNPQHGSLNFTNDLLSLPYDITYVTYTPADTNFTGTDIFDYVVFNECGDAATNIVTITIGDAYIYPNPLSVLTGTNGNPPVSITLSAADYDSCHDDTNDYTYTISGSLTNGTLNTNMLPDLTYTPTNGEGVDSFQFNASDGVWTSSSPATVTIYAVAGPILTAESITCYPFGAAVQLDWSLDTNVLRMVQQDNLSISGFVIYRSTNSGGIYTAIATNTDANQTSYEDENAVIGQTNYYVVTFESSESGVTYESPKSNEAAVMGYYPDDLLPSDATWDVTDITDPNNPTNLGSLRAPFSSEYPGQYLSLRAFP
ncbi:MAG: Ig-like domain-containing protein [Limisphaerales bacterium]